MPATRNAAVASLAGKNYIAYARSATAQGAGPKLQQQIRAVRQFADRLGMTCVCEVRLAGISGWLPPLRDDLRDLLGRKRRENDYEVLIMEDRARLTRTDFHQEVEAKFAKSGVRIVYVAEMGMRTRTRR